MRQVLGYNPTPRQEDLPTLYAAYPEIYPYDKEWQTNLNSLDQKRSSLDTYIQILNTIANGHAALDKASGGEGKGQETYCSSENSDPEFSPSAASENTTPNDPPDFTPNKDPDADGIENYKDYKDRLIVSYYIENFEKLVVELESLHSIYKSE